MSTLTAVVVLAAASALIYVLLAVALARADRRAASTAPRPLSEVPGGGGRAYVEVGAWSGRTYPPGAVVAGFNGKAHSRRAVVWAALEAGRRDLPLVVLYAANYPGMTGPPGTGLFHRDPGALQAAEELTARGVALALEAQPDLDVVGATEVTTAIRALTDASRDAALTVVGSRSQGRIAKRLLGSVSSTVAARATSPVVVVTEGEPERFGNRYATNSVP